MATEKVLNTVIQLRNGTAAEWLASAYVLRVAEIGIENDTGLFKIGNGSDVYKDLPYANDIKSVIDKNQHRYLDIEKNADETDNAAIQRAIELDASYGDPRNGDVCIVRKLITEGHWEYTAYAYSNDVGGWIAMDGNYNAENVYFGKDITATYQFGKYKPDSTGSTVIPAAGKSLANLFIDSFAEAKDPAITQPSVSISLTNGGAKEAGTKISPAYSVSFNKGKYEYGPDTGVTATYSVTDGVVGHDSMTSATGTFGEIQVTDGISYKASVTATYTQGAIPVNNIGEAKESLRISAGSKSASSGAISAFRQSFYGSVTSKAENISSAIIRSLNGKSGKQNTAGNTFNAAESVGAMRVIIAVPAPRTCTSIKDVNGLNAEAISAFTHITVDVEGANGYDAKSYNVYYKDNAAACDKANNWAVTLG